MYRLLTSRNKHDKQTKSIFYALLAALLFAINSPISKLLLSHVPPTMMAGFLYLGAGIGISLMNLYQKLIGNTTTEAPLTRKELPYTIGMVLLDIVAPVCFMIGLTNTSAANASLLNNFEVIATTMIALIIFKETITKKLWLAIFCITTSCILLSLDDIGSLSFSFGSLLILIACICWGFENNCTRKLSSKNPMQIIVIKGICSGIGSIVMSFLLGERFFNISYIIFIMLLGFITYGLSLYFYIYAQRNLGAAKTSAYYAIAPFIGVIISMIIFPQIPCTSFIIAFFIMLIGTWLAL